MAPTRTASGSTACIATRSATAPPAAPCISRARACIARRPPASPSARPAPPTSAPRTASCWSTTTPASAASCAPGPAPTARANSTTTHGVMKKCTLCVDRIYNENCWSRATACRPACATCPTGARHFGDLGDPECDVSQLVAERGGFDLMPEFGYKPVNKYLPPRTRHDATTAKRDDEPIVPSSEEAGTVAAKLFALGRARVVALTNGQTPCIPPIR